MCSACVAGRPATEEEEAGYETVAVEGDLYEAMLQERTLGYL